MIKMYVSPKYKIVFVCIPKSGSSSIIQMLRSVDPRLYMHKSRHAVLDESEAELFKDYFKFTVVRNSYKLCSSYYRFMTEKTKNQRQKPVGLKELVRSQIEITEKSTDWMIRAAQNPFPVQLDYFSQNGKILVDKIFFYDKGLDKELADLKKRIKFRGSLVKNHYYGKYNWKTYYTQGCKEYVEQICKKDIEYFGFKFED